MAYRVPEAAATRRGDEPPAAPHVVVIGGGASGALAAIHLLSQSAAGRVTLVEKSGILGCGLAYATDNPNHLLNTRVQNMSAFPSDPDHFLRWLRGPGQSPSATGDGFVGRRTFGRYLESMLASWEAGRLDVRSGECLSVRPESAGVRVQLDDGATVAADFAVLATGHAVPVAPPEGLRSGWDFTPPARPDDDVVVIGTGLSMVDHVVSLLDRDHRGTITCLSRRGLVPRPHVAATPRVLDAADVPFGASVSETLQWLRARIAADPDAAWQDTVDALRPHISRLWQSWSIEARRRFLRHGAAWWEVHRHRMPPSSAERIAAAEASGQLRFLKARFDRIAEIDGRPAVEVRTGEGRRVIRASHVIDCRGIRRDPATDSVAVVRRLIGEGQARIDELGLGIDTTPDARLVASDGSPSDRVFAIGPCARGALWEITAIPDIRVQCARLAAGLREPAAA